MSIFSENLPQLRRRAGYTQEGLAEALGVSRQAVGKWESGQSLPEAATLLELAELLGCSLDQLMRIPCAGEGPVPPQADRRALWEVYDRHMNQFALLISSGVALVLLGIGLLLALLAITELGILSVVPLLLCVAAAVFCFIWGGVNHEHFRQTHPTIPDDFVQGEQGRFQRGFGIGMALAIAATVADVALLVGMLAVFRGHREMSLLSISLFFCILAGAVGTIVLLGILMEKYDLESWHREAVREEADTQSLDELIDAKVEREMRRSLESEGRDWSGVIMLTATGIYLVCGFFFHLWHPTWVIFILGGILCGIVDSLQKKK